MKCGTFLWYLMRRGWFQVSKPKWERTKEGEEHFGWAFATSANEEPGADVDTLNGAKTVRELYEIGKSDAQKYTVPVWDRCHLEGMGGQAGGQVEVM